MQPDDVSELNQWARRVREGYLAWMALHPVVEAVADQVRRRQAHRYAIPADRLPDFAGGAPGRIYEKLCEGKFDDRMPGADFRGWCATVLRNDYATQASGPSRGRRVEQLDPRAHAEAPWVAGAPGRAGREAEGQTHWDRWFRENRAGLESTAPLPDADIDVIWGWEPRDRILLPAHCGFWHRVPPPLWTVWVAEDGVADKRHFPSRDFVQRDDPGGRLEILARDLGESSASLRRGLRYRIIDKRMLADLSLEPGGPS